MLLDIVTLRVEMMGVLEDGTPVEAALQDVVRSFVCRKMSSARQ